MGTPIMSAVATARVHALGGENAHTVLSGVTTAIVVNTALCVVTAILVGIFPRPAGQSA